MAVTDFTLFDVLRRNAAVAPDRTALVFEGERLTHADCLDRAERLAAGLARAGVRRGDRVAVLAQNRPEHLDALAACARLGAILLPVNWRLGADEIAFVLRDGAPKVVIAEAELATALALAAGQPASVTGWYAFGAGPEPFQPYDALLAGGGELPPDETEAADGLVIIHTAAVGGEPRGALLSHANLLAANLQLMGAWSLGPDDVALVALPLFHISGLGLALAVQHAGGASAIMRRFEAGAALDLIEAERVTVACEFAPMLGQMLDAQAERVRDLSSFRAVWGLDSPDTIARFEATLPGARFWAGYGQSETSGYVTFAPHRDRPGSAGRPAPLARIAIADEDDRPVPDGTVGHILVRGPLVFNGYWNRPEDNAETFRGGWHHTGDMGRLADGFLHYAGRSPAKELIKSGGENVYPAEVERALREHPAVADAVVIGVPDPRWGESVLAICERASGETAEEAMLIAFVGERIARYKRPKRVVLVDALPRAANGTVDRAAVKAEHGG